MGICEVLIPLTDSPSSEVQGNSAAALGNLSSKGMFIVFQMDRNSCGNQMAGQAQTIILHSTTFGIDLMVACIGICIGS